VNKGPSMHVLHERPLSRVLHACPLSRACVKIRDQNGGQGSEVGQMGRGKILRVRPT
jgi:hypothetical protein